MKTKKFDNLGIEPSLLGFGCMRFPLDEDGKINEKEAEKMIRLGKKKIPEDIDYEKVDNLATEARQKLEKIRPRTIDQATRISGVNPSDIAILMVYLKRFYNE